MGSIAIATRFPPRAHIFALCECSEKEKGVRLGYMGHMVLVAEEVVKVFQSFPVEIYAVVEPHLPQPDWSNYISTTLKETRERDLTPLGGGISIQLQEPSASTSGGALSDDDEFPNNPNRASKIKAAATSAAADQGEVKFVSPETGEARTSDQVSGRSATRFAQRELTVWASISQFSRYLASAISSDRPDKFGSSDEDDDDDDVSWIGTAAHNVDDGPEGFVFGNLSNGSSTKTFGFDDRFEPVGGVASTSAARQTYDSDDEDGDWGAFTSDTRSGFGNFSAAFSAATTSTVRPATAGMVGDGEDDDFGDFAEGPGAGDFDFNEDSRTIPSINLPDDLPMQVDDLTAASFGGGGGQRPTFLRRQTADDGSNLFGGLTSAFDDASSGPPSPAYSSDQHTSPASAHSGRFDDSESDSATVHGSEADADLATSFSEPLGPGMSSSAHLTTDGQVEAVSEVDGSIIRVPADDVSLPITSDGS